MPSASPARTPWSNPCWGESFAPVLPSLCWPHQLTVCSAQRESLYKLKQPWLLSEGGRQVTHLSLEALQPHDVLAAGGILLPKVLPEGVDLHGELPLHLRRLQGHTSWSHPVDPKQPSPPAQGDLPGYNFCTSPVSAETLNSAQFG